MKKTIIILLGSLFITNCKAQGIVPKEVKNAELNQFVGTILSYQKKELNDNIISCIIIASPKKSESDNETDEISNSLYISNCQFGELVDCKLYAVDNLIMVKVENIIESSSEIIVEITSGNYKERKKSQYKIPK